VCVYVCVQRERVLHPSASSFELWGGVVFLSILVITLINSLGIVHLGPVGSGIEKF